MSPENKKISRAMYAVLIFFLASIFRHVQGRFLDDLDEGIILDSAMCLTECLEGGDNANIAEKVDKIFCKRQFDDGSLGGVCCDASEESCI